jgi:hypothetical protein
VYGTQVDTSYLIGNIVMLVLLGLSLFVLPPAIRWVTASEDVAGSQMSRKWAYGIGGAVALVMALIFVFATWPFWPGQYNSYKPFSGVVRQTGSRFIASDTQGGGSNQRFMLQLTSGVVVGCDDTRCSALHPGDKVTVLCERSWQWNANAGWVCNFGKYGLNTSTAGGMPYLGR